MKIQVQAFWLKMRPIEAARSMGHVAKFEV
jgi:hypothetical protein